MHPNTCYQTLLNELTAHNCHSLFTQHPTNEKMWPWVLAHRTFIKCQSAASFGIFVFKLPYICNSIYQHHSSSSFFNWHYNPLWVLVCFTISFQNPLSLHFSLQFLTFIFFKSSSTCSSHLSLDLPTGLDEHGSHSASGCLGFSEVILDFYHFSPFIFSISFKWFIKISMCIWLSFNSSFCPASSSHLSITFPTTSMPVGWIVLHCGVENIFYTLHKHKYIQAHQNIH